MLTKKEKYTVAIVGATGLVGTNFIKVIEEYQLPIDKVRLFASERSVGKTIEVLGQMVQVEGLSEDTLEGIDVALFSAGGSISKIWAPIFASKGALVIDNSSAWRMDPMCPLIVPEVNPEMITLEGIIANPNCSTIQAMLPLKALDNHFHIKRVNYSTYQAVSGSGQKGIDDYQRTKNGEKPLFYPYDISKTCIPEIDRFLENGYTYEEMKMVNETRKILNRPDLKISATCIRVPIEVGHGVLVKVLLDKTTTVDEIKKVISEFEGIVLVDDPNNHIYPTSIMAMGNDQVYVGRIREDISEENSYLFYCVADNVRKGAASNAVQIFLKAIEKVGSL